MRVGKHVSGPADVSSRLSPGLFLPRIEIGDLVTAAFQQHKEVAFFGGEQAGVEFGLDPFHVHIPFRALIAQGNQDVSQIHQAQLLLEMGQGLDEFPGVAAPPERLQQRQEAGRVRGRRLKVLCCIVPQRLGEALCDSLRGPGLRAVEGDCGVWIHLCLMPLAAYTAFL